MNCGGFSKKLNTFCSPFDYSWRAYLTRLCVCISIGLVMYCFPLNSVVAKQHGPTTFSMIIASDMPDISDPVSGRYAELQQLVRSTKKKNSNAFFLFGGGSIGPSAFSNLDRGSHIIDLLNNIEPDAMGLAKRDFSFLEDELSLRAYEAAFPIVSSNLRDKRLQTILDGTTEHALIKKGNLSLGFISVMDERMALEYLTKNVFVTPPEAAIRATAKKLRAKGADAIVLHFYQAYEFVSSLLEEGIVDIAFNSHTRLQPTDKAILDRDPRILHLDTPGVAIVADLSFNQNQLAILNANTVQLTRLTPEPFTQNVIDSYKFRLDRILDERIGRWDANYSTIREEVRAKENAFGSYIADTMREFADTDIALVNGGSIRGDRTYKAGTVITRRTIATELPFRSTLRVIEIKGTDLLETLEYGFSGLELLQGTFLHLSGMKVEYNSEKPIGNRVVSVTIAGEPLLKEYTYSLATTDYLADGGDGFIPLTKAKRLSQTSLEETILISDLVLRNIQFKKSLINTLEGRIIDRAVNP